MDKKEKIKKLFEIVEALKGHEEYFKNLPAGILMNFQLEFAVEFSDEEAQKKLEAITTVVEQASKELIEEFIQIYDDTFTEEEIDDLIVLHQHPAMVKTRQNDERIAQMVSMMLTKKVQGLQPDLLKIFAPDETAEKDEDGEKSDGDEDDSGADESPT